MRHGSHYSTKVTPQTEPIPGSSQVQNSAGGFAWKVDKWERLRRFLILGSEGGTYYVGERKLTVENAQGVVECIKEDPRRAVSEIVRVSKEGRAPKNDPAIFALALACTFAGEDKVWKKGFPPDRKFWKDNFNLDRMAVYPAITAVCRTGTHLFTFCQAIQDLRGWSRGLRRGVAAFYERPSIETLEYQLLKYQQRDGWTHRDVLRLCHPKPDCTKRSQLLRMAVGKVHDYVSNRTNVIRILREHPAATPASFAADKIRKYRLSREMLPTELLNSKQVWDALLDDMPMTAMIRNLGKMSAVGLIENNLCEATHKVCERLRNKELLKKARVHPLAILNALRTYAAGHGEKGKLTWTPATAVTSALNDAFYLAFDAVEPTNKAIVLALDVSGSMDGSRIAGTSLTAREASAALALVTAATEKRHEITAFATEYVQAKIPPKMPLELLTKSMQQLPFGGTDCALPMLHALKHRWEVDAFVVYTDSETYAGKMHPKQALDQYRQKMGRDAKLVVVGMTSGGFTIADPNDGGMLDVVGFDTALPAVINDFIRGADAPIAAEATKEVS